MRVVVANVQTPFVRGGAEMLADSLLAALGEAGHSAELVRFPFKWYPTERIGEAMLAARLMELDEWVGGSIDRLIGLKFPAYLIRHPEKVLWLLHQYRGPTICGTHRPAVSSTRPMAAPCATPSDIPTRR